METGIIDQVRSTLDQGMDVNIKFDQDEVMQLAVVIFVAVLAANIVARVLVR